MISITSLITAYWGAKLAGAVVALWFWVVKLVDKKRQQKVPVQLSSRVFRAAAPTGDICTAERPAPVMAGKKMEQVAKYEDVAPHMKTGQVLLFSGRSIWSYILRIGTFSDKSHAGLLVRDDEGVWVVDSCEGRNVTKRLLFDDVKKFPGQWYLCTIRPEWNDYHPGRARDAALAMIANKTKYGWPGIVLQAMIRCPVLRELAYIFHIDKFAFFKNRPFCSQALKRWMKTGSLDPVPRRDEHLVTPQDINQSLAIHQQFALIP